MAGPIGRAVVALANAAMPRGAVPRTAVFVPSVVAAIKAIEQFVD
jgi:hypothetical protein